MSLTQDLKARADQSAEKHSESTLKIMTNQ